MSDLYGDLGGWIETFSGERMDILNPDISRIDIDDIAHSLALQCRYTGHTKHFYSVAQHCVLLARWAKDHGWNAGDILALLLHDAHEFIVGDVASPLKQLLPDFKRIDKIWEKAIRVHFNLTTDEAVWKRIKDLDIRILVREREVLMPHTGQHDWCLGGWQPLDVEIDLWSAVDAEHNFMDLYWSLTGQLLSG